MAGSRQTTDEAQEPGSTMKRRGLMAGAAALVMGGMIIRTAQPVQAATIIDANFIANGTSGVGFDAYSTVNAVFGTGVQGNGVNVGVSGVSYNSSNSQSSGGFFQGNLNGIQAAVNGATLPVSWPKAAVAGFGGGGAATTGVDGRSDTAVGVNGQSDSSDGVYGSSGSSNGVYGISTSGNGVYGVGGTNGQGRYAGHGVYGVGGTNNATSDGIAAGVYGQGSTGLIGVKGSASGGYGVFGETDSGYGVYAFSQTGTGLWGESGGSGYGVSGSSVSNAGVYGNGTGAGSYGVLGIASGGSGARAALYGASYDLYTAAFYAVNYYGNPQNASQYTGYAGYFLGKVFINGAQIVAGAKSAAVPFPDGSHRLLYCMESPEAWFEDFGTGTLTAGKAEVKLDPDFATTVDTSTLHVFAMPHDEAHHLAVKATSAGGFSVAADPSGPATARGVKASDLSGTFTYRVVAKRKDVQAPRLAKFDAPKQLPPPPMPPAPPPAPPKFDMQLPPRPAPPAMPVPPAMPGGKTKG